MQISHECSANRVIVLLWICASSFWNDLFCKYTPNLFVRVEVTVSVFCLFVCFVFMYLSKWCTYSANLLLLAWCHVRLLQYRRTFCVHHTTILQCRFMQSHIRRVPVMWLAVTFHQHFQQNDRDLLRATVVTRGWTKYRDTSQHRKLTLEKKIIPPLLPGLEPATFRSRVQRSTMELSPLPKYMFAQL